MGRLIKLDHKRRCDFCSKPVNIGYKVSEGPTQGFFCGARHARAAYEHMESLKKENNQ